MSELTVVSFTGDWPIPSPSPFCLKLETWLRMAGIPYVQHDPNGPPKSKTGKVPYIIEADGSFLEDSAHIIEVLTDRHSVTLDQHLSPADQVQALLIRRLVEDHLYFATVANRWLDSDNWAEVSRAYFGHLPPPIKWIVPLAIRRGVRRDMWGQGVARRPLEQVYDHAVEDLDALAALLGDRDFFFGEPSSTDAVVYGPLENIHAAPLDGPLRQGLLRNANLVAWLDRMRTRYWAT